MKDKITSTLIKNLKAKPKLYEVHDTELPGFMVRVQPSGSMTYYIRYRLPNGERGRFRIAPVKNLKPAQARDEAKKKLAEASLGKNPSAVRKNRRPTLGDFIDKDYKPLWLNNRKSGLATYNRLKKCFPSFWHKRLDEISPGLIEKWRAKRLQDKIEPTTVNRDVGALKAVMAKAVEWDVLAEHPLAKVKPLKDTTTPKTRYLKKEEKERLFSALLKREQELRDARDSANEWRRERGYDELPSLAKVEFADHLRPMVILSLFTGLRRGELFSLMWDSVDFENSILTVQGDKAKSGKVRHVPLHEIAYETLRQWKSQTGDVGLVFTSPKGEKFDNVNSSWRAVMKRAQIDNFRWHDMRHDFASNLVMRSGDLNAVREILGHSDLKMTQRYAHLAPEHKMSVVARLVEADNVVPFLRVVESIHDAV